VTRPRVVVTGVGIVCGLGVGREACFSAAIAGRSAGGPITRFDTTGYGATIACEARDFRVEDFIDHRQARRADRITHLGMAAARLAVDDARLVVEGEGRRVGVIIGAGTGGNAVREEQHKVMLERGAERVSPFTIPHSISNMPCAAVAMEFGMRGPVFATVTACAAGTDAIGTATSIIRRGDADVMLAGGSDAMITPLWVAAFDAMRVLSHRNDAPETAARPFDATRDGFLMGEGSAVLVLETLEHAEARGAHIICEVAGYGASADAHHLTDPDPTGHAQARSMRAAMNDAGVTAEQIGYVNAHGGASQPGDPSEVAAIRTALGDDLAARTPVSSTKSVHGHCMGATGAIEAALTALAVQAGTLPPTINLNDVDPACVGVDHIANIARTVAIDTALTMNNGLGGQNAALVLRRMLS
jgi:3-oxoacyl-[acyl-carrier-protein] synthase II